MLSLPSWSATNSYPVSWSESSTFSIMKRLSLVSSERSSNLTFTSGLMSVIVINSLDFVTEPAFNDFTGFKTNGSSSVPAPETKFGSDVVCSGSGPTRTTLSRFLKNRSNSNNKRSSSRQYQQLDLSSSSSSPDVSVIHSPFSSTLATSVLSAGSLPHFNSNSSKTPSLSSSLSISSPVTELSSGSPSPSASARMASAKVNSTPVWLLFEYTV